MRRGKSYGRAKRQQNANDPEQNLKLMLMLMLMLMLEVISDELKNLQPINFIGGDR